MVAPLVLAAQIAGATKAVIDAATAINSVLERSCMIEVINMTPENLEMHRRGTAYGSLGDLVPSRVAPFDSSIITANSSFGVGAEGNLGFQGRDIVVLMDYSNPLVGDNTLQAKHHGTRAGEFLLSASAGPGNKSARFTCVITHQTQDNWRFCARCHGLFANGPNSRCPSGDSHTPVGWEYALIHSTPDGPNLQSNWRFCPKCLGLFANGPNSRCPAGGPHDPVGWNYCVPHALGEARTVQANWRFCPKCLGLFWNGPNRDNHLCPAGGLHDPVGWGYALPHKP